MEEAATQERGWRLCPASAVSVQPPQGQAGGWITLPHLPPDLPSPCLKGHLALLLLSRSSNSQINFGTLGL